MTKLTNAVAFETAFNTYTVDEVLGEGGAGKVYGGTDESGNKVAIKVLGQTSSDKRRRFKNEIAFLSRARHKNLVKVTDHGVAAAGSIKGPFYVMDRYAGSLRGVLKNGVAPAQALGLFSQILDGVEAAHLLDVAHRDLKPENVLVNPSGNELAIADFGVASFTQELLHTLVQTSPMQRLANFQYAAPEQRTPGQSVNLRADIYALGLMLNEMFTGSVPHGTDYRTIGSVANEFGFLDPIVAAMLRSDPSQRPGSIAAVKQLIQKHQAEAVSLQKLSQLEKVVIPAGEVDDPLAHEPPSLVGVRWNNGLLYLELDRPVNEGWVRALKNMGSFTSVWGIPPEAFHFDGNVARVTVDANSAQAVIDHFKPWLLRATQVYKQQLEDSLRRVEMERLRELQLQKENEERNLRLNQSLRI